MDMQSSCGSPFRLSVLATGGTIEKEYDAHAGTLRLDKPMLRSLLDRLEQPDIRIAVERVMMLDSLEMGEAERATVVAAARDCIAEHGCDAVLITHGTDTLAQTARAVAEALPDVSLPIVLTGAMRPFRVADSDALQNVAQAIMAARLLAPGVYTAFHGRVIPAAHVVKDYDRLTLMDRREPNTPG